MLFVCLHRVERTAKPLEIEPVYNGFFLIILPQEMRYKSTCYKKTYQMPIIFPIPKILFLLVLLYLVKTANGSIALYLVKTAKMEQNPVLNVKIAYSPYRRNTALP